MLLSELVESVDGVAGTASRSGKVTVLAELISRLPPGPLAAAVCLMAGSPRQGRVGVGWASLAAFSVPPASVSALRIADLDDVLTQLLSISGKGSAAARTGAIRGLLERATGAEQDFVRRLLVGEVRHGALEGIVVEAVARAARVPAASVRRALMLCGDLGRTAEMAMNDELASVALEVLRPIQPMLASTAADVAEALARAGRSSVEWKLDGVRIQVHRDADEVRVYTRKLNDITSRVPEIVAVVRALPVTRIVLDGEAIALDADRRPHSFQDVMSRVGRKQGDEALVPLFFDCLHADGEDLIDRPLAERVSALDRVAREWRIPAVDTELPDEAARVLAEALDAGHEGVVVKALGSSYEAGRRGKAWLKVKPVRTFDLVVLGAEWGHGRRRGWLSNLHLGARGDDGAFVMVGKTFKGLTDELLKWQTERFLALETERQGIVVFVRPDLVVEIELDGVHVSPRYPGGVALRFARVLRYREDKHPAEADTIDALRALLPRQEESGGRPAN